MDDFEEQYGTFSLQRQALCIVSKPSVNLNWSSETLNSAQNLQFLFRVTLKFDGWPSTTEHLFYTPASLYIISKTLVSLKWSYSPEALNSGQNQPCVTSKFDG